MNSKAKTAVSSAVYSGMPKFDATYAVLMLAIIPCSQTFTYLLAGIDPDTALVIGQTSPVIQNVHFIAYLIVFVLCGRNLQRLYSAFILSWPLLLFSALAMVSAMWSPDPWITIRKAIAFGMTISAGICIAARYPGYKGIRLILQSFMVMLFISLFIIIFAPQYGVHGESRYGGNLAGYWRGIFSHKNAFGNLSAIVFASAFILRHEIIRSGLVRLLVLAISLLCLIKAGSASGFIAAANMLGGYYFFKHFRNRRGMAMIIMSIFGFLFVLLFEQVVTLFFSVLGKSETLSGRTPLWNVVSMFLEQHWVLGSGFASGFDSLLPYVRVFLNWSFVANAQNGYLDVIISLGVVGLALMVASLAVLVQRSLRLFSLPMTSKMIYMPILITIFVIAVNVVEAWFDEPFNYSVILFSCVYAAVTEMTSRQRSASSKTILRRRLPPCSVAARGELT